MKKTLLAAALAACSFSALASSYYVVVPVPNHTASTGNILVTLNGYSPPSGVVGRVYAGFDFNSVLQVLGDPSYNPSDVRWSVAGGALPAGMSLSGNGKLSGTPTTAATSSFQVLAAYKTKAGEQAYQVLVTDISVGLTGATIPGVVAGNPLTYDLKQNLSISGDPAYAGNGAGVAWSLSGSLPAGLSLGDDGVITGTPTAVGAASVTVTAGYESRTSSPATYSMSVTADIKNTGSYRAWSDGTFASSCQAYKTAGAPYAYSGDTGDGVYRVNLGSTPTDVYCDQTTNGGGWTLLMKQASGDGVTLEGDTAYWTSGTTLNDNAASMNMNNGNFVSAAFARMSATQYMLQAANESTVQTYSRAASTPQSAFSSANTTLYSDANGVPMTDPNWFVHTTTYPDGEALTQARFGFNFGEVYGSTAVYCGARWGWAANQDVDPQSTVAGSDDSCGGLGAYGSQYGSTFMNQNKNAWQPATLYLWAK